MTDLMKHYDGFSFEDDDAHVLIWDPSGDYLRVSKEALFDYVVNYPMRKLENEL